MKDWIDSGGAAFPSSADQGMSLRDWFAGQAIAGIGAWAPGLSVWDEGKVPKAQAKWAYEVADAMLAARKK